MRVLQAPVNYANQAQVLSQALCEAGVDSHLLRYQWEGNSAVQFYREEGRVAPISRSDWFGDMLRVVQQVSRERYDIVHLWNRTLLWRNVNDFFNGMDLPYLRQASSRIAYRFTGYDLRRKSLELKLNPYTPYRYGFETNWQEDGQQRYLESLAPYVDRFVVQDPEMQTYCPQAAIVPRAIDLAAFPVTEAIPTSSRPLVVHAPSQRLLKGSNFVMRAVDELREEGLAFDFLLIEDMPNAEALEHYRRADIVIDQLLVGWYGVLSIEGMALGKTVIAYIREDLLRYFKQGLPLLNANPDTIKAVLREAIRDAELRRETGRHGRAFVEQVHDSHVVAATVARMYGEMLAVSPAPSPPNFAWQLRGAGEFRVRFDQDRLTQSQQRVADLEQLLAAQTALAEKLDEREKNNVSYIQQLRDDRAGLEQRLAEQRARGEELDEREKTQLAFVEQLKDARSDAQWEAQFFNHDNDLTTAFIRFARRCRERAEELAADAYVAHGVQALLAANAVAGAVGGRVYGDVVEMPSFAERSEPSNIDPINLALLDQAFAGLLREADGISTIGWALKEAIEEYGPRRVIVIPNYRYAQGLARSTELREQCGLGPDDRLLLAGGTITSGFEPVIEALALLPANIHLATLGTMPDRYRSQLDAMVEALRLGARVHFYPPVPYERLTTVLSGADIGLMAIDPSLGNDRVSLPNRLFDAIAAGLPIVTPNVTDIARIVRERDLGVTLATHTAAGWAEAIQRAFADAPRLRANALAAAQTLTWESLADELLAAYDEPRSVTILSFSNLTMHQRTRRIARTLAEHGVRVTVCCPEPEDKRPAPELPGVRFVFTPRHAMVPPRPGSPVAEAAAGANAAAAPKRLPTPTATLARPPRGRIVGRPAERGAAEIASPRSTARHEEIPRNIPSTSRAQQRSLRVLHAPVNYANQASVLSEALRVQGVDSRLLLYQWEANDPVKFYEDGGEVRLITRRDWLGDMLRIVEDVAAEGFDVVHFWNRSLLYNRASDFFCGLDIPCVRQSGARIGYRFTGYDLRRRSLELELNPYSPYRYGFVSAFEEENQERYLEWLTPYVDRFVVQDPEMHTYCPQAQIIPRALDLGRFPLAETAPNARPLVVHAPSNRAVKGSDFVLRAVEVLKEENRAFDFVLVENMHNAEALELYRRADIVIDQLLIGWYGVLAMEAMAMAKATIAYIRPDLTAYFGEEMPLLNANPDTMTAVLRDAIGDAEMRREYGRRGRAFVERVHDRQAVAHAAVRMYEKMMQMPAVPAVPNFSPVLSHSLKIREWYDEVVFGKPSEKKEFQRLLDAEKAARLASEAEAKLLRDDAARYEELKTELPGLQYKAQRYEEVKTELPGLRYKAQRYDETKDQLRLWKSKAEQFDRLAATPLGKLALPLLGSSRPAKAPDRDDDMHAPDSSDRQ